MSMDGFLRKAKDCIQKCNGKQAAAFLKLGDKVPSHVTNVVLKAALNTHRVQMHVNNLLSGKWAEIVSSHIISKAYYNNGKPGEAFKWAKKAGEACEEIMAKSASSYDEEGIPPNWYLPIVDCVLNNLRKIAYDSDKETKATMGMIMPTAGGKNQREAYDLIRAFLNLCNQKEKAVGARSKKMGTLFIVNHLFKLAIRINLLRGTALFIRSVDNPHFPSFDLFAKSQTVTYNYYKGRLNMMEENYTEAETCLDYALKHCHKGSVGNKTRVLQFLIPLKLLKNQAPHKDLFSKYPLQQYEDIVLAIKTGNLRLYNELLRKYEDFFVSKGIYLLMVRLKRYVYCNLVRKVFKLNEKYKSSKPQQISLKVFRAAFKFHGVEVSEDNFDEIECIIANLIHEKFVKGYLAHGRALVLSTKSDKFPKKNLPS